MTHRSPVAVTLLVLLSAACAGEGGSGAPAFLSSDEGDALDLPFSEAVRTGELIFVSGQIGNRPGSLDLVPGGIQPQASQALRNVQAILERHGSGMNRVVKCSVFLLDMADWPAFNEVYVGFFPGPKPARSALGASGLAVGALVEVECIAAAPRG